MTATTLVHAMCNIHPFLKNLQGWRLHHLPSSNSFLRRNPPCTQPDHALSNSLHELILVTKEGALSSLSFAPMAGCC